MSGYRRAELQRNKLQFDKRLLPYFTEWKSMASGDYALGLEPSNTHILGRRYHEEQETMPMLQPFEKRRVCLKMTILDGEEDLMAVQEEAEKLIKRMAD